MEIQLSLLGRATEVDQFNVLYTQTVDLSGDTAAVTLKMPKHEDLKSSKLFMVRVAAPEAIQVATGVHLDPATRVGVTFIKDDQGNVIEEVPPPTPQMWSIWTADACGPRDIPFTHTLLIGRISVALRP
ncbi:hypothetical protein MKK84_14435 [Methylobacterium sp. E-065]|uniref:hypothetical protein n=1 Tax=Methylobacterium sp. E-065 TaxID=2836583 RepID=UPI001FB882AD|nr:hypothetical protein [Methylobacterium sp. E-065]MCJ2018620.1 hypothetical protein [Methylobacterium sp. E-065]